MAHTRWQMRQLERREHKACRDAVPNNNAQNDGAALAAQVDDATQLLAKVRKLL